MTNSNPRSPLTDLLREVTDTTDGSTRTIRPGAGDDLVAEATDMGMTRAGKTADSGTNNGAAGEPQPDRPDHVTSYITLDGAFVEVEAWRGTQMLGSMTGNPIDATKFGRVRLNITDNDNDAVTVTFTDPDDLTNLMAALNRASSFASSRNTANDATRD